MAATNFTPISLYYSTTASAVPSAGNLVAGELALNTADMKLYAKNSAGTVTLLASSGGAAGTVSSVAVSGGTTGLTTSGGPITTSGTITLAGTLGTANGGTGLTAFTANQVFYASSTSAIAQSANMTFNGTTLTVNDLTDSSLTATRVVYAGTAGNLTNSANLTFDGTNLSFGGNLNSTLTSEFYLQSPNAQNFIGINQTGAYVRIAAGNVITINTTSANTTFYASATRMMDLTSTGLGIGTSSPAAKLHVEGGTENAIIGSSTRKLYFRADGNGVSVLDAAAQAGNGFYVNSVSSYVATYTGSTERLRIANTGAFGLSGANYGNAGEVLTSGGSGAAPTWAAAGGGSQAFVAFGTTGGF
jgi:hypothetical protein